MSYNFKKLPPFKFFVLQNFPFIEADFDAITNYQLLCKVVEYLNKVIDENNAIGEQTEILTDGFNELQNYVTNYFDNLDVQDEIDNKLDEMAESGELVEIIGQYLQLAGIFGYDTISDMKSAENLTTGSICRTLGRNTYNDGYGNFYRVRGVLTTDVIDDYNIVSFINLPTLVAERIPDNYLADEIDDVNDRIDDILEELTAKKWIFVGDSYAEPPTGVTAWTDLLQERMGLTSSEVIFAHHGGAGFANPSYPFYDIINELTSDNSVTDILIAGGYNDLTFSDTNIVNGINSVATLIGTKFPNAKVHLAVIGGTTGQYHGHMHLLVESYIKGALNNNWHFLNNTYYVLYNKYRFLTDGVHPNQDGQTEIAKALNESLIGEYEYVQYREISIDTTQSDNFPEVSFPLHLVQKNDISILSSYSGTIFLTASQNFALAYNGSIKLGKIDQYGIIGTNLNTNCQLELPCLIVQNYGSEASGYFNLPATLRIDENGYVYVQVKSLINDAHTGYLNFTAVHQIQIPTFSVVYPTIMM